MMPVHEDFGRYRKFKYKLKRWNNDKQDYDILLHCGHDFDCPISSYVFAVGDCEVVYSSMVAGYGGTNLRGGVTWVKIKGKDDKTYLLQYGHIKLFRKVGELLKAGEIVGIIDHYLDNGIDVPHLHFCVYEGEKLPSGKWGYRAEVEGFREPLTWLENNTEKGV